MQLISRTKQGIYFLSVATITHLRYLDLTRQTPRHGIDKLPQDRQFTVQQHVRKWQTTSPNKKEQ